MASRGTGLVWLTALATASLGVSGCQSSSRPSAVDHPIATPATHHSPQPRPAVATSPAPSVRPAPAPAQGPAPADRPAPPRRFETVVSDGTAVVRVGGRDVRFPGPVTDAVASPNGTSLAYVDGRGDIATARLDGTGMRVLTTTDPGVVRAHPTFEDDGAEVVFSERGHDGVWRLKEVATDGHDDLAAGRPDPDLDETASDGGHDTSPSATWSEGPGGDSSVLVFEHRTARGRTLVYVADRNQRGFGARALLPGRSPAVSPTGDRVAFLGATGQVEVASIDAAHPRGQALTRGAHPAGSLVWSPDGHRVVFSTDHDVESVSTDGGAVRVESSHPGVATYATLDRPAVGAVDTSEPVAAALAVSRATYTPWSEISGDPGVLGIPWADHVVLVGTADPSAAAPAAAVAAGGPVLFVDGGTLDPQVREEIVRLLHRPRGMRRQVTVDIVGSTTAVPDAVATELQGLGLRVRRFDPATAAADASRAVRGRYLSYVVVSADDLPGIVAAAGSQTKVLLTDGSTMPAETAAELDTMPRHQGGPATVYAVGSAAQAAVRSSWTGKRPFRIVDLGGSGPSGDSLAAVGALFDGPSRATVTTAGDWRQLVIAGMGAPTVVVSSPAGPASDVGGWLAAGGAAFQALDVVGGSPSLAARVGRSAYGDRYVLRHEPAILAP